MDGYQVSFRLKCTYAAEQGLLSLGDGLAAAVHVRGGDFGRSGVVRSRGTRWETFSSVMP